MNDFEPPRPDKIAPQTPPSKSSPFLLESIFLGPQGVRAGWRAALYVALFLFLKMRGGNTQRFNKAKVIAEGCGDKWFVVRRLSCSRFLICLSARKTF